MKLIALLFLAATASMTNAAITAVVPVIGDTYIDANFTQADNGRSPGLVGAFSTYMFFNYETSQIPAAARILGVEVVFNSTVQRNPSLDTSALHKLMVPDGAWNESSTFQSLVLDSPTGSFTFYSPYGKYLEGNGNPSFSTNGLDYKFQDGWLITEFQKWVDGGTNNGLAYLASPAIPGFSVWSNNSASPSYAIVTYEAVPEPTTALLAALTGSILFTRRRRIW